MSGIRYRKRVKVFPGVHLNVSRSSRGWSHSWSLSAFGVTHNTRSKKNTVDLPGGLFWQSGGKGKGQAARSRAAHPSRKGSTTPPDTPRPYRAARWPYPVLALLLALGILGGAIWQSVLLWGLVALVVLAVQRGRRRAAMPVHRDAGEPVPEDEDARVDPDEAERIVRDWTPPADWRREG